MNTKDKMYKVLKDTRDWYAEDPEKRRCIDKDGNCIYTWGDNHCAVGRYLKSEYQIENWRDNKLSANELSSSHPDDGVYSPDWALRKEVHGIDPDFWNDLQFFHDSRSFWNYKEGGLTSIGKEHYVRFEDKIAEGKYDG
tara:strand:+ start:20 stop:436 length:417 start_codon:yes stop_codon:yes gene_type:complete